MEGSCFNIDSPVGIHFLFFLDLFASLLALIFFFIVTSFPMKCNVASVKLNACLNKEKVVKNASELDA